jgi:hypothetical protein
MRERVASIVLLLFVVLAIGNFAWIVTERPAGSALVGGQKDGRYLVVNHGESAEVDRATWDRRRAQEILLLISFPIVVVGAKIGLGQGMPGIVSMLARAFAVRPKKAEHRPDQGTDADPN